MFIFFLTSVCRLFIVDNRPLTMHNYGVHMEIIGVGESVLQYLRVHIINGEFTPGQKLNEIELSSGLSISRAPLREAFRVLENEHLVVSIPRKGCYVTELSLKDCQEIFEARVMIECTSIDLLKARGIRNLPEVCSALGKTADLPMPTNSDPYRKFQYLKTIADFHIKLVESAGNSRLTHFYNGIFFDLARYQAIYTYVPGLMDTSHKEHEEIVHFIQKGNYDEAKRNLEIHVNKFIELISDKLQDLNSE